MRAKAVHKSRRKVQRRCQKQPGGVGVPTALQGGEMAAVKMGNNGICKKAELGVSGQG